MISIHAHARFEPSHPIFQHVMPLQQAIQIVGNDNGRGADSRRRRAAAKLTAYWLHRFPQFSDFSHQIDALAGPDAVDAIENYLTPTPGPAQLLLPPDLEPVLQKILQFLTPQCAWQPTECVPEGSPKKSRCGVDASPPGVGWTWAVLVPANKLAVSRALDPQSWSTCPNAMFWASHLTPTSGPCCEDSYRDTCSFTTDSSNNPFTVGDPIRLVPPKTRGMPYGFSAFYEDVCTDLTIQNENQCLRCDQPDMRCDACFENLLCVRTRYDVEITSSDQLGQVSRYDVDYKLEQALLGEILGTEGYDIDKDQGKLFTRDASEEEKEGAQVSGTPWSFAQTSKEIHFVDSWVDAATGAMFQLYADEMAGEFAEIACCDVPFERWGMRRFPALKPWRKRLLPFKVPLPVANTPELAVN